VLQINRRVAVGQAGELNRAFTAGAAAQGSKPHLRALQRQMGELEKIIRLGQGSQEREADVREVLGPLGLTVTR
jgi:hypothetical protein